MFVLVLSEAVLVLVIDYDIVLRAGFGNVIEALRLRSPSGETGIAGFEYEYEAGSWELGVGSWELGAIPGWNATAIHR
jgi:hypothetical protein